MFYVICLILSSHLIPPSEEITLLLLPAEAFIVSFQSLSIWSPKNESFLHRSVYDSLSLASFTAICPSIRARDRERD